LTGRALERKIEEGLASARRGELLDGDTVMQEIAARLRKRQAAPKSER